MDGNSKCRTFEFFRVEITGIRSKKVLLLIKSILELYYQRQFSEKAL